MNKPHKSKQYNQLIEKAKNIEDILKNGEEPSLKDFEEKDDRLNTILHIAVEKNLLETIKYIIEKKIISLETRNIQKKTPILFTSNLETLIFLKENRINLQERDKEGRMLIHYASYNNHKDIIEFLLENGVEPNVKDFYGNTPMHYALQNGNVPLFNFLDSKGGDMHIRNNMKLTPAQVGLQSGKIRIVKKDT